MKIQLPNDSSGPTFIDVLPPEPVLDRKTKQQKADVKGEPRYSMELGCSGREALKWSR